MSNRDKLITIYQSQKDVIFSTITQLWKMISGPLTLILIPLFITSTVQGYWYTFISLSALSVFADLGFTTIILQFSAHEYAFLKLIDGRLEGESTALDRIASLFRFVVKWTAVMIVVVFPIIAGIGFYMFHQKSDDYFWILPWVFYLVAASGSFFVGVLNSFIQGCEQVAKVQRIVLYAAVSSTLVLLICLVAGLGLYALSLSLLTNVLVILMLHFRHYRHLILQLWHRQGSNSNWRAEILPLLARYALSWSSGYFIFQIYTPLMFQYHGPIEAGKVGITMSLFGAIFAISNVWFAAKTPRFNILVAEKKWAILDHLFLKTLLYSVATYALGILTLYLAIFLFKGHWPLFDKVVLRFLGYIPFMMLIISWFIQLFVNGMAVYLRAHKQEPYMYISILGAAYIGIATLVSSRFLPADYLFLGFLTSQFIFIVPAYLIFRKCRMNWHSVV